MPVQITAIELENFQSIERRTRIDFKPLTLLFGPNSAGKSTVFDALELLRVLLDPTKFDEKHAAALTNRWARRKGDSAIREMFLAIEFPCWFDDDLGSMWSDNSNWPASRERTEGPAFYWDIETPRESGLNGSTARIELQIKLIDRKHGLYCGLSEYSLSINGRPILKLSKTHPNWTYDPDDEDLAWLNGDRDPFYRWLIIHDEFDEMAFLNRSLASDLRQIEDPEEASMVYTRTDAGVRVQTKVVSESLSPWRPGNDSLFDGKFKDASSRACRNASDLMFYFGTLLWSPMRGQPGVVMSDRRTPNPNEALALVDLKLAGWWARESFSPSSPASLLISGSSIRDDHFQGLAEAAHADLLWRAAKDSSWGGEHASQNLADVRERAEILARVNYHLDKSLFKEKLYKLSCASTLLVPIDLSEDDPQGYYALAQPAAVRLFLEDGTGQKVELQDVGSGIPFVLPILYAASCQGFVKVQQPELHLHPALQSSIADVFIEELNREGAGQFLIETHSEHLLLRLLRRIRDQEKGRCLSPEMRLTDKDIAVYYFDPQVSGGTIVTQQLVTPLGDFFTDWPRGFFAERDGDLFDE